MAELEAEPQDEEEPQEPPARPPPKCQACGIVLPPETRAYLKRYKVCQDCVQLKEVQLNGAVHRFCQQCGAFHPIEAFREDQRSCRAQLAHHAARRRRRRRERSGKRANSSGSEGQAGRNDGGLPSPHGGPDGAGSPAHKRAAADSQRNLDPPLQLLPMQLGGDGSGLDTLLHVPVLPGSHRQPQGGPAVNLQSLLQGLGATPAVPAIPLGGEPPLPLVASQPVPGWDAGLPGGPSPGLPGPYVQPAAQPEPADTPGQLIALGVQLFQMGLGMSAGGAQPQGAAPGHSAGGALAAAIASALLQYTQQQRQQQQQPYGQPFAQQPPAAPARTQADLASALATALGAVMQPQRPQQPAPQQPPALPNSPYSALHELVERLQQAAAPPNAQLAAPPLHAQPPSQPQAAPGGMYGAPPDSQAALLDLLQRLSGR